MTSTFTVKQALDYGRTLLRRTAEQSSNEALLLLQHATNKRKETLIAHSEQTLSDERCQIYKNLLRRRSDGEPIAYILKEKEFWSLQLQMAPGVLIPRPETELLVEMALERIPTNKNTTVLDLGTGSGCIALAIASERPHSHIIACDNSSTCINTANRNAERLGLKNISFIESNWFENVGSQTFDVIVSNPPYISEQDPDLQISVREFEPENALIADEDGLSDIKVITKHSRDFMNLNGCLILEHGWNQGSATRSQLEYHRFQNIATFRDLQNHERVTLGEAV